MGQNIEFKTFCLVKKDAYFWLHMFCDALYFLEFAVDWMGYYGGHEFVKKAAGHDLKGLVAIYQCQIRKLMVPLMCLIDYKGYRLIAISALPISDQTLVYGR